MSRDDILRLGADLRVDGAALDSVPEPWTLVLAHGAGQGMDSPFMESMARQIAARGLRVVRFEFPYMGEQRRTGARRPPDRQPRLIAAWHETLDRLADGGLGPERLLIGGKSLGGRMASLVALERPVAGLVCLGYPFHPPGRPEQTRVEHLRELQVPTLICQGTRDPFGLSQEVAGYGLSAAIRLVWIEDGEHSLKPGKSSNRTWEQNFIQAADALAEFTSAIAEAREWWRGPRPSRSGPIEQV
jgi:predicted alpha/beta-hydrolase family hydrolase